MFLHVAYQSLPLVGRLVSSRFIVQRCHDQGSEVWQLAQEVKDKNCLAVQRKSLVVDEVICLLHHVLVRL